MTPAALEASSRLNALLTYEIEESRQNDWQKLDLLMRVIYPLVTELLSLNSRLDEIETRLSTSMPGSEKPNERPEPMPPHGGKQIPLRQSWS